MRKRDEISHLRIKNPKVRRQWVPLRELEIDPPPSRDFLPDYVDPMAFAPQTGWFRVKRRLSKRINEADRILQFFVRTGELACITGRIAIVGFESANPPEQPAPDHQDQGVLFRFAFVGGHPELDLAPDSDG